MKFSSGKYRARKLECPSLPSGPAAASPTKIAKPFCALNTSAPTYPVVARGRAPSVKKFETVTGTMSSASSKTTRESAGAAFPSAGAPPPPSEKSINARRRGRPCKVSAGKTRGGVRGARARARTHQSRCFVPRHAAGVVWKRRTPRENKETFIANRKPRRRKGWAQTQTREKLWCTLRTTPSGGGESRRGGLSAAAAGAGGHGGGSRRSVLGAGSEAVREFSNRLI